MLLLITAALANHAWAIEQDEPAIRAVTAGAVSVGSELVGLTGGVALGAGAALVTRPEGLGSVALIVAGGGIGLVGGAVGGGAVAGVATRRSPLVMTGVTAGVSLLGGGLAFATANSGGASVAIGLGTLAAVPVAAGVAAALLPEHEGKRRAGPLSLTPTLGKRGAGVRLAGNF